MMAGAAVAKMRTVLDIIAEMDAYAYEQWRGPNATRARGVRLDTATRPKAEWRYPAVRPDARVALGPNVIPGGNCT